jgi:hypothetical protein
MVNDSRVSVLNIFFLSTLSLVLPTTSWAFRCNALLEHGLRNIRISQGSAATTNFLYNNHCYKNFEKVDDQKLAEAEIEIFGFGRGKVGYDRKKREERLVNWCKTSKKEAKNFTGKYVESRLIYDKALQAYTSCNNLAANNIRSSVQITADQTRVNVNLRYLGGAVSGIQFLGINHQQNFTCTITGPRLDGKGLVDYTKDFINNNNVFIKAQATVINCIRSNAKEEKEVDGIRYKVLPKAAITIDTAQESFLLDFPEAWPSPGVPVTQYNTLKQKIDSLKSELQTVKTELKVVKTELKVVKTQASSSTSYIAKLKQKVNQSTSEITSHDGFWGSWQPPAVCGKGQYVCGLRSRVEGKGQNDDTALNSVRLKCCSF